jgi:hypothetical protein
MCSSAYGELAIVEVVMVGPEMHRVPWLWRWRANAEAMRTRVSETVMINEDDRSPV